jgi:hypothetical protein
MKPLPRTMNNIGMRAALTGTVANLVLTAALAALTRAEGRHPLRPFNAPSHWLHGRGTGRLTRADLSHTGLGFLTNHGASIMWALPLQFLLSRLGLRSAPAVLGSSALVSALAALIDYGILPRRLSPGWEEALPTRSVAAAFGALAIGLAAGALLSRAVRR